MDASQPAQLPLTTAPRLTVRRGLVWAGLIVLAGLVAAFPSMTIPPPSAWPLSRWLYWPVVVSVAVGLAAIIITRYVSERAAGWLLIVTVVLVAAASISFNAAAPAVVNQSDRNTALNVAITELAHGRYPYFARTQLRNPISPLPGALVLAAPFVLGLGSSAYQNYFWLLVLAAVLANFKSARWALLVLWCALASPLVLQEFLFQSDFMANSMYLLVAAIWFMRYPRRWWAGVFLGIALASRINAIFYAPLLLAYVVRRDGWRSAAKAGVLPALTAAALIVPFYLYSPAEFGPLRALSKVAIPALPGASLVIALATVATVAALCLWLRTEHQLWAALAAAQAVPVLLTALAGFVAAQPMLDMVEHFSYGQSFVLLGLVAVFWEL